MTSILFGIVRICRPRLKCNYFWNQKHFVIFLFHFWNLHQTLNILKKKMVVTTTLFQKLPTVKDLIRQLSKKHCFRTPFDSQHVKYHVKSQWKHFHDIFSSLWWNLISKKYPLVICEILGGFRNTLTANDKYPVWECENFLALI